MMRIICSLTCASEQLGERLNNSLLDLIGRNNGREALIGARRQRRAFQLGKEGRDGDSKPEHSLDEDPDRGTEIVVGFQFGDRILLQTAGFADGALGAGAARANKRRPNHLPLHLEQHTGRNIPVNI